jgi:hypothetical protein
MEVSTCSTMKRVTLDSEHTFFQLNLPSHHVYALLEHVHSKRLQRVIGAFVRASV